MVPRVRRIVANGARSLDRRLLQCVVEAANAADGDRPCVEDLLTPRDCLTRLVDDDQITIRRVAYDIEREVTALFEAQYPAAAWLAEMLRKGAYMPPPD